MFYLSICTKANYRKLLHLFTLENLKGKQSRPPSKNISMKRVNIHSQDLQLCWLIFFSVGKETVLVFCEKQIYNQSKSDF